MHSSTGVFYRSEHQRLLNMVALHDPDVVSETFQKFLHGRKVRDFVKQNRRRSRTSQGEYDETCFWVDVHIDGLALFKNSTKTSVSDYILIYLRN